MITLDGAEAVQAVYSEWTRTDQCVFYTDDEKLAVSDHMIVSTSTMYQQTLGSVLAAEGAPVDPDAMYLVKIAEHMIWPYDDTGRLVGEDVWEYDDSGPRHHQARPGRCPDRRAVGQVARPAHQATTGVQPVHRLTTSALDGARLGADATVSPRVKQPVPLTNHEGREMTKNSTTFRGKLVVITGGGSGIGRETALAFARRGAEVVLSDVNLVAAKQTAAMIDEAGGTARLPARRGR
jgi:hypothetical protein